MLLTQSWVGYLDRSYEQIKKSLLTRLGVMTPEITDHSESNPFIILISFFAGVAEVIHLYLDSLAREAFIGTARRYSSVVKLSRLVDYDIKARNPATVNLLFTLRDGSDNPTTTTDDILIDVGTLVYPQNSTLPFRTTQARFLPAGISSIFIPAQQSTQLLNQNLGSTAGTSVPSQRFQLSAKYVHGSLQVTINSIVWKLYNSFGLMDSDTEGFVVEIDENQDAFLVFGDGVNGEIPPLSATIFGNYLETEGSSGNISPGLITELQTDLGLDPSLKMTVNNPDYSSGGTEFEGIEEVRDRAPRSIRTLQRAVTYSDYVDLALLVPGVGAAEVKYCCGKYVDLYIVPSSRGVATLALLNSVKNDMSCKIMITTQLDVKPAGVSRVWIKAKIVGKPLFSEEEILRDVYNKWDEKFGYGNLKINKRISITDIITETELLDKVDTLEIDEVRVEPYVRPIEGTSNLLNITFPLLPHTTTRYPYKLIYRSAGNNFELYKNGLFLTMVAISSTYTDGSLVAFNIGAGTYSDGDTWEFQIHPSYPEIFPTTIIEIKDNSAPIIDISPFIDDNTPRTIFGDITVEETGTSTSCLPSC